MSTKDLLRARFAELQADRAKILAATQPWRKVIDDAVAKIDKIKSGYADEKAKLLAANKEMAALDEEISRLAFALGGKRMSDV